MRVKDGQPKIQFQTFADMINFPVKPGEQPETSTSITEVLPLELLEGYPNHEEHFPLYTGGSPVWYDLQHPKARCANAYFGLENNRWPAHHHQWT